MTITRDNYEIYFLDYIEGNLAPEMEGEFRAFLLAHPDLAEELEGASSISFEEDAISYFDKSVLKKEELPLSETALNELLVNEVEGKASTQDVAYIDQLSKSFPSVLASRNAFAKTILPKENIAFEEKATLQFPSSLDMSLTDHLLIAKVEGDLSASENAKLSALLQKESSLQKALGLYYTTKLKPEAIVFDAKSSLKQKEAVVIPFGRYFAFTAAAASVALLVWMGVADRTQPASMAGNWKKEIIETPAGPSTTDSTFESQNNQPNVHSTTPQSVRPSLPSNNDTPNDLADDIVIPTPDNKAPGNKTVEYSPDPIAFHGAQPLNNVLTVPQLNTDMALIFGTKSAAPISPTASTEYMTVWQFAENEAKTKLWGSTDYPKDGFALALAQREVSQIADKYDDKFSVQKKNDNGKGGFRIKLGKFEFSRNK